MTPRLVAGCMTGTSIDSIDAAVVRIAGRGLEMRAEFVRGASRPLGDLAPRLRGLAEQVPMSAGDIAGLSREFSLAHIPVLRESIGPDRIDLACIHGQTVFHLPPVSWQMLTPACIAAELRAPVVFDLRAADLAAGGQGAPITPIADWVLYRDSGGAQERTVVNLGGFCNMTVLPGSGGGTGSMPAAERVAAVRARDVCACNQLLDAIARRRLGAPYDDGGGHGMKGRRIGAVATELETLLRSQSGSGRSLGTGDELARGLDSFADARPEDLLRSACDAISAVVASNVSGVAVLAGGGVRNLCLLGSLRERMPSCITSDETGIPHGYREAACFAVLGALCQDRVPITLPAVTGPGGPAPVAGTWVLP